VSIKFKLPKLIFGKDHDELANHARNVQELFNKVPVIEHRTIEALYDEPMTLQAAEEPFSIELVRIANVFALEQPVTACNAMVHYVWRPNLGGAQITNIGGMSVATNGTTKYRFYYRITYRMA
jgi:hypothetical protein